MRSTARFFALARSCLSIANCKLPLLSPRSGTIANPIGFVSSPAQRRRWYISPFLRGQRGFALASIGFDWVRFVAACAGHRSRSQWRPRTSLAAQLAARPALGPRAKEKRSARIGNFREFWGIGGVPSRVCASLTSSRRRRDPRALYLCRRAALSSRQTRSAPARPPQIQRKTEENLFQVRVFPSGACCAFVATKAQRVSYV